MRVQTSETSASWRLDFQDARPPQKILAALERDIVKVFSSSIQDGRLAYSAQAKINGVPYEFELCYEAALPPVNGYSLRVAASWANLPAAHHDYFSKSTDGWINFWTRNFKRCDPMAAEGGSAELYAKLRAEALQAEARLNSVEAIQQIIVAGMKRGATFSTAHKEGGTILRWTDGHFIRSDYGESSDLKKFADETEFLNALRQFYDWETSSAVYPNKASDFDAWKLMLRKLNSK
jgi:hypothetical protein